MGHLQKMNSDQFSMAIMDEVFNSINPEEGEAGTYGYLKTVAQFPNAINISTTHYAKPMMLAQHLPETFLNMHVSADMRSDNKLRYDYYLKPGYSI